MHVSTQKFFDLLPWEVTVFLEAEKSEPQSKLFTFIIDDNFGLDLAHQTNGVLEGTGLDIFLINADKS